MGSRPWRHRQRQGGCSAVAPRQTLAQLPCADGSTNACRGSHPHTQHPPALLQYIFALTMDVDGYPGGALWRSDNNGRSDSWRDATPAIAASLPQVGTRLCAAGGTLACCALCYAMCAMLRCVCVQGSGLHDVGSATGEAAAAATSWLLYTCGVHCEEKLLVKALLRCCCCVLLAAGQHHAHGGDGHPLARNQARPHPVPGQGAASG